MMALVVSSALGPGAATAGEPFTPGRPVHTYSIVAHDPQTGQMGVAVQSHWFSVGSVVTWAEAGVGAVATQSIAEVSYGPLGLELMRGGKSAPDALKALLAADAQAEYRQVAMVDAQGRIAAHTGSLCIAEAGHKTGEGYSAQANLMLKNTVWDAMSAAYTSAQGDLAERLLAALEAAEREGGDIRGRQSAAILIVGGKAGDPPWVGRVYDLRVEDHPQPVQELRRLVQLNRAYNRMNHGDELFAKQDVEGALKEYAAAQQMAPDNAEMVFWTAVTLAGAGRIDDALPLFRKAFAADPNWAVLLPRLPKSKMFPDDPALLQRILAAAPH
jgi:uncharacterized Ntn-hydrolase superfamily protein